MSAKEAPAAPLAEQFVAATQQREAALFGMWIFLGTEVLFFGGLLLAYSAYRIWYFADFRFGSHHLDFFLGTTNTAILLTSSFLMAGAVSATRLRERRSAVILLVGTALLGALFLGIKGYEWHTAIDDGFWPANNSAQVSPGVHLFYSLYFCLTGLHGIHLFIGICFILATAFRVSRLVAFQPNQNYLTLLGLYWHFVDIVWFFLYPLLYFIGRSS